MPAIENAFETDWFWGNVAACLDVISIEKWAHVNRSAYHAAANIHQALQENVRQNRRPLPAVQQRIQEAVIFQGALQRARRGHATSSDYIAVAMLPEAARLPRNVVVNVLRQAPEANFDRMVALQPAWQAPAAAAIRRANFPKILAAAFLVGGLLAAAVYGAALYCRTAEVPALTKAIAVLFFLGLSASFSMCLVSLTFCRVSFRSSNNNNVRLPFFLGAGAGLSQLALGIVAAITSNPGESFAPIMVGLINSIIWASLIRMISDVMMDLGFCSRRYVPNYYGAARPFGDNPGVREPFMAQGAGVNFRN